MQWRVKIWARRQNIVALPLPDGFVAVEATRAVLKTAGTEEVDRTRLMIERFEGGGLTFDYFIGKAPG